MRRLARRSSVVVMCAACFAALPAGGCSGDGSLGDLFSTTTAMDLLTDEVKNNVEGYLSSVNALSTNLGNIQRYADLLSMLPNIQPLVEQLTSAVSTLSQLSPETRGTVLDAFGRRLKNTNGQFSDQLERIQSTFGLAGPLTDLLKGVELFG